MSICAKTSEIMNSLDYPVFKQAGIKSTILAYVGSPLHWSQRPTSLKEAIERSFKQLGEMSSSKWGAFNGDRRYNLMTINEYHFVLSMIRSASSDQKEFYIIDIGAGNWQLIEHLAALLSLEKSIPSSIKIHLIGVRGENSDDPSIEVKGICTIYRLGLFKIEELSQEFRKRNLSLKGRVDLILSRWCLRHCVDPVGTFLQAYHLLRPGYGFLLFDGFFFLPKNEQIEPCIGNALELSNARMVRLLSQMKEPFLMTQHDDNYSLNQFLLKRTHAEPCSLLTSYVGVKQVANEHDPCNRLQIKSNVVTVFEMDSEEPKQVVKYQAVNGRRFFYGDPALFSSLKSMDLIQDDQWRINRHVPLEFADYKPSNDDED